AATQYPPRSLHDALPIYPFSDVLPLQTANPLDAIDKAVEIWRWRGGGIGFNGLCVFYCCFLHRFDYGKPATGNVEPRHANVTPPDRKSTRLNSSHVKISY